MSRQPRNSLASCIGKLRASAPVRLMVSGSPVDYETARKRMRRMSAEILSGESAETVWLLEHPPLYTAGTSARESDLLDPRRFPVYRTGRGGQYTYHGPGQRIVYVMLDLRRRGRDVRAFVTGLEQLVIDTLADLGIEAGRREDRVGVWVSRPDKGPGAEDKIAAIGVRVSRWITRHGIAINAHPDLEHFSGIVPCGISAHGVTSLEEVGAPCDYSTLDAALIRNFERIFGPLAE